MKKIAIPTLEKKMNMPENISPAPNPKLDPERKGDEEIKADKKKNEPKQ